MVVSNFTLSSERFTERTLQRIKVLQHSPAEHLPGRRGDPKPTSRNLDPNMHPFARQRERMRALNAAKMERMFSKPFVGSLDGHVDAVEVMSRKPQSLSLVASASWDGGELAWVSDKASDVHFPRVSAVIVHDVPQRRHVVNLQSAHKGKVSGLCWGEGDRLLSCGVDRTVKLWDTREGSSSDGDAGPSEVCLNFI